MIFFAISFLEKQEDKDFVENLYRNYIAWLRYRASKTLGNDFQACEDVAHECMVNLIKHIDKLQSLPENKQRAYMAAAIDNTALNYAIKHSKVTVTRTPEAADLDFVADGHELEDEVEKNLKLEAVRDNIDLLPKRDRDLIVLKYELELSDEQIGEVLDIKKDCVRMTLRRSVQKLSKLINKKGAK